MLCGLRLRLKYVQYTAAGVLFTVTVPLYMYVQKLLLIATLVENRILCQSNNSIITIYAPKTLVFF
jgi:hypothetical protein